MTDTLDQFLLRLEDVNHQGAGQWTARCPVSDHGDRHASLSVGTGDKGVQVWCHAGCTVDEVCAAVGWNVRDLFFNVIPINGNGHGRSGSPRHVPRKVPPAGSARHAHRREACTCLRRRP